MSDVTQRLNLVVTGDSSAARRDMDALTDRISKGFKGIEITEFLKGMKGAHESLHDLMTKGLSATGAIEAVGKGLRSIPHPAAQAAAVVADLAVGFLKMGDDAYLAEQRVRALAINIDKLRRQPLRPVNIDNEDLSGGIDFDEEENAKWEQGSGPWAQKWHLGMKTAAEESKKFTATVKDQTVEVYYLRDAWRSVVDALKPLKELEDAQSEIAQSQLQRDAERTKAAIHAASQEAGDSLRETQEIFNKAAEDWERDPFRVLRNGAQAARAQIDQLRAGGLAMGDAFGRAFAMMASGAHGAGAAFKESLREQLFAEAAGSAAMAVKALGVGFYDIAIHDYPGAAAAFKAAAIHAAFAAAYGGGSAIAGAPESANYGGGGGGGSNTAGRDTVQSEQAFGGGKIENHYYLGWGFGDPKALIRMLEEQRRQAELEGTVSPRRGPGGRRS